MRKAEHESLPPLMVAQRSCLEEEPPFSFVRLVPGEIDYLETSHEYGSISGSVPSLGGLRRREET